MAGALVHRLMNHQPCEAAIDAAGGTSPDGQCLRVGEPSIHLDVIMTDKALFDGAAGPAVLTGYSPIPAPLGRQMVMNTAGQAQVWLRRLYAHPETGALMAMDSRARLFPDTMKRFLLDQDQICAIPWCDAPIREYDHVRPVLPGMARKAGPPGPPGPASAAASDPTDGGT